MKRIPRIVEQLSKHSQDVLLLTEYWEGEKGEEIKRLLRENGMNICFLVMALLSKIVYYSLLFILLRLFHLFTKNRNGQRWLEIRITQYELHIIGVHIPINNNDIHVALFLVTHGTARREMDFELTMSLLRQF